ncbi:MAG TPA: hypothetical protein VK191_14665 [Symbiobacteriaceae bacterium]|nr:hypothetical protein [Symbiobacteriaceae bacterium]
MILVVAEQLNLSFILQHQGQCVRSTRTVHEALQILRATLTSIQGVIIDERIENSRLITAFMKANAPALQVVPWRIAERNSPFKRVSELDKVVDWRPVAGHRYQLQPSI